MKQVALIASPAWNERRVDCHRWTSPPNSDAWELTPTLAMTNTGFGSDIDDWTAADRLTAIRSLKSRETVVIVLHALVGLYWVSEALASIAIVATDTLLSGSLLDFIIFAEGVYPYAVIATGVAFVVWSYKAHANLVVLGRNEVFHQDQATIWWWIVPIAFLFMPFRVVFETVRGSTAPFDDPNWRRYPLHPDAGWWAGLFRRWANLERGLDEHPPRGRCRFPDLLPDLLRRGGCCRRGRPSCDHDGEDVR